MFDRDDGFEHPTSVVTLTRRASAIVVALALSIGNVAVCAGWAATPEARMACCTDGAECPMHKSDSSDDDGLRELTQAQADSCCALSEGHSSGSSSPTPVVMISAVVLGPAIILPAPAAPTVREVWRSVEWRRADSVPKHVLLSVFLV